MGYAIRLARKTTELLPEEVEIKDALGAYCFDPALTSCLDFVPTRILHAAYLQHVAGAARPATLLNATQFGVALRKTFGIAADRKTRRLYQGRKEMGYCYVRMARTCQPQAA